jgi:hypothetical protein
MHRGQYQATASPLWLSGDEVMVEAGEAGFGFGF